MTANQPLPPSPDWYRDAVIYEVHVRAFADSNGDGIGDFVGLTSRLDYLSRLGVTAIWLLPFYPSPLRDDGYDIAEYFDVHSSYGTLDEFCAFLDAAHTRNMRVITELVINHTSDQHPWFQRARRAEPGTPERDFYVWSDTPDRYSDVRVIFQDTETSNWAWDPVAGAYYWHRFFSHQPDLNYDNSLVRDAVTEALDFWLGLGVDGLRLDAIPYLFEREGTNGENLPETHQELKRLRAHVDANYTDRMLLAEANQWPEDSVAYFGDGDECHMSFHFPLMPRLYLALERETRLPIIDILEQTPPIPEGTQWAIFLRNHDELTLEMVSEEERDFMWRTYAPDRRSRLNLGIRRRLAPLIENDRRRIELLFSLLFSLPGTPVLYYGDEIGMGDNTFLPDRDGVRTPMQWSNNRNAGFSEANPQSLYLPVVVDPQFHYETVNVEAQHHNPNSLLWWVRRMIGRRAAHPVFGRGSIEFLSPENPHVLAYLRQGEGETIVVVVNLSRHAQFVELDLSRFAGHKLIELLGRTEFPMVGELPYLLTLSPYGFYWFAITPDTQGEVARDGELVLDGPLEEAFQPGKPLTEYLLGYVARQPWYQGRYRRRISVSVFDAVPVDAGEIGPSTWITLLDVEYANGPDERYVVPVSLRFDDDLELAESAVVARVRRDGETGVLYDALMDPAFRTRMLTDLLDGRTIFGSSGTITCHPGLSIPPMVHPELLGPSAEVTETTEGESYVRYGDDLTIKLFRRVEPGVNPDLELRRFLTERTGFRGLSEAYGSLEYQSGEASTLGVLQRTLPQGQDAWTFMLELCSDWLETVAGSVPPPPPSSNHWARAGIEPDSTLKKLGAALENAERLGRMTGEFHLAMGSLSEDPDLHPLPFSSLYQQSLYQSLRARIRQELEAIRRSLGGVDSELAERISAVAAAESSILRRIDSIRRTPMAGQRIRVNGDFRLDGIQIVDDEFFIVDFSGDHSQPMSERRLRASPLRDVAQMVRSIDYVAASAARDRIEGGGEAASEWAAWWSATVGARYVGAYLEAMEGSAALPDEPDHIDALLEAYAVTRSLRELHWELDNRPDWIEVAMSGVQRLIGLDQPDAD